MSDIRSYQFTLDKSTFNRCLLCNVCTADAVCPEKMPIGRILRSLYFRNYYPPADWLTEKCCKDCSAPCEKACILGKHAQPVEIRQTLTALKIDSAVFPAPKIQNPDLSMNICGVRIENPFMLSSSVVGSTYDMCARAFRAGWAGVSFKTICAFPQHETSPRFSAVKAHAGSFYGFKNIEQLSDHSVEENMEIFRRLKQEFPTKVIIASIMGRNETEWGQLAKKCEDSGADIIECNFSCPNMEDASLGSTIGQSAELVERFTRAVKKAVRIPVLAKLTPNVTDMTVIAKGAKRGGADGIAAINTINSITGVNIETLVAEPEVHGTSMIGGYSGVAVKPIALRFISDLMQCKDLEGMHISGMGGIETWRDAVEFILMGAGSLQVTTAVMQYGYRIIDDLIGGLTNYLACKGIPSAESLIGIASNTVVSHEEVERDSILYPVFINEKCNGCGRCYVSCMDGGHQAITMDPETSLPKLNGKKCVGCHLCLLVCPSSAIRPADKRIQKIT